MDRFRTPALPLQDTVVIVNCLSVTRSAYDIAKADGRLVSLTCMFW